MEQTTVIVNQPQSAGQQQNIEVFTSGICGCFEDCGGCIFATFCFTCFLCGLATKMKESCVVGCCLGNAGLLAMRTKLRTAYGIQGSICGDCMCASFFPMCTACQVDRELNARGIAIF